MEVVHVVYMQFTMCKPCTECRQCIVRSQCSVSIQRTVFKDWIQCTVCMHCPVHAVHCVEVEHAMYCVSSA